MTSKPAKVVSEYSPDELARFKASFQPSVSRYRTGQRTVGILIGAPMVMFLAAFALVQGIPSSATTVGKFIMVPILVVLCICWLSVLFVTLVKHGLTCPACNSQLNGLSGRFGPYCPECGNRPLEKGSWLHADRCLVCGKIFWKGKGPSVRIRACSHCGILVSEEGICV